MEKKTLDLNHYAADQALELFGVDDKHIKVIEELLEVRITINHIIEIEGDVINVDKVIEILKVMKKTLDKGHLLGLREVTYLCQLAKSNQDIQLDRLYEKSIITTHAGKTIYPKTNNQKALFDALGKYDVVFAIGPAGTGKTYLAVAYALALLKREEISKIILTRPAVEAGESLGYLPGDLKEKIDPYLRPLYDALYDILGAVKAERLIEQGVIEVAPLAFMRGRTLEGSFVILDEAQNTTVSQMKMFLTRLGFNSKMVINGDITQIDLPRNVTSGLMDSINVLKTINEIKMIYLNSVDVVRNPLVQKIIEAYKGDHNV